MLFNALFLLGGIGWVAIGRLRDPASVTRSTVIWVALVGIAVTAGTAALFVSGRRGDLNVRRTFLHMAADAGVSLGVVVAGLVILATGWDWLDPAMSLAIVAVIVVGNWGLLRESLDLALDAVPPGIDPDEVRGYLAGLRGVREVHDLHVWAMSTTETALTAHLVMPGAGSRDEILARVCEYLHDAFGIEHATLQVEHGDAAHPCRLAAADTV